MSEINTSRELLATAIQVGGRWAPEYALPGGVVMRGDPLYESYDAAMIEANRMAVKTFNNIPPASGKPDRYKKISGATLAEKISQAGITATFFAFLFGTSQDRVIEWARGEDGVPHPAFIMLEIFRDPEIGERAIDIAECATEAVTENRLEAKLKRALGEKLSERTPLDQRMS